MKAPDTEELIKDDAQFTDLMSLLIERKDKHLSYSELLVVLMLISSSHWDTSFGFR